MTREELINYGEMYLEVNGDSKNSNTYEFIEEALKLFKQEESVLDKIKAEIKEWYWQADKQALAEDPCVVDAMIDLFIRTINKYEKGTPIKHCEKAVSVQDCINAIENTDCELSPQAWKEITTSIMSLPPAILTRKKGKWIKIGDRGFGVSDIVICKCSECEYKTEFRGKFDGHYLVIDPKHAHKYCPSCGLEMENAERNIFDKYKENGG